MNSFGFSSTATDVLAGVDLSGQRALITGANSGIGVETARALAAAGAEVVLAVRNVVAGKEIAATIPGAEVAELDLASLHSVQAFVAGWDGPLHMLINNAGIMGVPELTRTPEGHELQFAVNFLGHFALVDGLHDALAAAGGARIVSLSSNAHLMSPPVFDDLDWVYRPYTPIGAYGDSKTATVLLAVEATRRWADDGIVANAVNPGAIATNLQKHTGGLRTPVERRKTIEQGAATSVLAATLTTGGQYYEDCAEAAVLTGPPVMFGGGVAPFALDPGNAGRLWEIATDLVTVQA
jgi:NAD(P)-dependent dehydrogenase (short-subunit alcohol dehydrogenase family)